jgi:hypothetical protein
LRRKKGIALFGWAAWAAQAGWPVGSTGRGNSFQNKYINFGICQGFGNLHKRFMRNFEAGIFFKKILLGFPRILEKYNMPCHEMHPM